MEMIKNLGLTFELLHQQLIYMKDTKLCLDISIRKATIDTSFLKSPDV